MLDKDCYFALKNPVGSPSEQEPGGESVREPIPVHKQTNEQYQELIRFEASVTVLRYVLLCVASDLVPCPQTAAVAAAGRSKDSQG